MVSPLTGVIPLPNGHSMAYKWGLLRTNWDDPPSMDFFGCLLANGFSSFPGVPNISLPCAPRKDSAVGVVGPGQRQK